MKIVHLPVDARPCNVLFPGQLAQWCGHECVIPSPDAMDHITVPAPFECSRDFLLNNAPAADALVVSVDHLCYGSLLESRNDNVPQKEALDRLQVLETLHALYPDKPIYAYNVVMRSSISALYASELTAYRAMTDYSMYSDRFAQTGDPADEARVKAARVLIPDAVMNRYQAARARNHAVNRRCVELAAQGVLQSLLLLQEDAELWGFHRAEQRALQAQIAQCGANNVWLHNGTDEAGALTVMKALSQQKEISAAVVYAGWPDGDFVARYEDRPFFENVNDSLAYAGVRVDADAKTVLAVCCPPDGQQTDWEKPECIEGYRAETEEIARLARSGRQVYLLDQIRGNGGSPMLMRAVYEQLDGLPLAGYSGWNTADNALGTAIAQIISDQMAGRINRSFLWERLLDDLAYQGAVREKLNNTLEGLGDDLLHLKDPARAQALLQQFMQEWLNQEPMFADAPAYSIFLPWNRTFEAQVQITE